MIYGERQLVLSLAEQLQARFNYKVHTHKKPSASRPFCHFVNHKLGFDPIIQPEVDIIVQDSNDRLNAIEVKLFQPRKTAYAQPFYSGIGQALALLNYGFDHVALWFLFFEKDRQIVQRAYGSSAWHLVRHKLGLPLDFSFFEVEEIDPRPRFRVMQRTTEYGSYWLGVHLDSPRFRISWKHPNPMRGENVPNTMREAMELYLSDRLPPIQ